VVERLDLKLLVCVGPDLGRGSGRAVTPLSAETGLSHASRAARNGVHAYQTALSKLRLYTRISGFGVKPLHLQAGSTSGELRADAMPRARDQVIVHHAAGLHEGVTDRGADKFESVLQ